ncbi:hypothetical protein [Azohydromonas aeria]|uniref:hypothetical protein n=1 Tax=Azohydromonas aeria TaxID=2590212 RepID=UPI0012FB0F51|nr:hypothetical protein [Azohydromonas aeria]
MGTSTNQDEPQRLTAAPPDAAGPAQPPLGVTLDLFGDADAAHAGPREGVPVQRPRGKGRTRRGASSAVPALQGVRTGAALPDTTVAAPEPARAVTDAPALPRPEPTGAGGEAVQRAVEQALLALAPGQLRGLVGDVATAIVRSTEFQMALRAQLYTLVAPAIGTALRDALSLEEVRESLRAAFGPHAPPLPALPGAVREALPVYGGAAAATAGATPRVAQLAPASSDDAPVQPLGQAVLLAGYEPAVARGYKAALAAAGYEALIVEIGPNDQALPLEAFQCAIACLPDDAMDHVESVVSRHPLRQVLHLSATARRLVEAVEVALPLELPHPAAPQAPTQH